MKKVKLNPEQKEAIKLLKAFIKSDSKEFCLYGAGGTGKTFIISELFKKKRPNVNEYYIPRSVIGLTVTHMARLNLMSRIPNTTTYASAVNLQLIYDNNGNIKFVNKYGNNSHHFSELRGYKYIVVDECSMFSNEMKEMILLCVSKNAKVIWLGDNAQLPPVESKGNEDSPTFDVDDRYELTIPMRQKDEDSIYILGQTVREKIFTDMSLNFVSDIKQSWNNKSKKGYSVSNVHNVITSYVNNFRKGYDIRITAYRNRRIAELNLMVRNFLWDDMAVNKYVVGEFIVMDEQYAPDMYPLAYSGQTFYIKAIDKGMIEFIECYLLSVERDNGELIALPVPTDTGLIEYRKRINEYKSIALQTKDWSEYHSFKSNFAFVSYAYAMNNYKIQGSTIKGCYVDLSDIMTVKMISNKRKLQAFYVGISRPTDFLAIF